MNRPSSLQGFCLAVVFGMLSGHAQPVPSDSIAGRIGKTGVEGATIFLCDAETGLPLQERTRQKITTSNSSGFLNTTSDSGGRFIFTNISPGSYRLVAQRFQQSEDTKKRQRYVSEIPPSEGLELLGTAENVQVPSAAATNLTLVPLGKGSLTFDQKFPNDGGYLLLSTRRVSGDAILGFLGWNQDFVSHLIGVGCNPRGGTLRVTGLPETNIQAVIFANDNAPGFGATYYDTLPATAQKIPVVAGWSDAQHEPPPRIRHIMEVLETNNVSAAALLKLARPRAASMSGTLRQLREDLGPLDRMVELPNGEKATVADVFACISYKSLMEAERRRRERK